MRTAHCSCRLGGGCSPGGVCLGVCLPRWECLPGGICRGGLPREECLPKGSIYLGGGWPGGVAAQGGVCPPMDRILDSCL